MRNKVIFVAVKCCESWWSQPIRQPRGCMAPASARGYQEQIVTCLRTCPCEAALAVCLLAVEKVVALPYHSESPHQTSLPTAHNTAHWTTNASHDQQADGHLSGWSIHQANTHTIDYTKRQYVALSDTHKCGNQYDGLMCDGFTLYLHGRVFSVQGVFSLVPGLVHVWGGKFHLVLFRYYHVECTREEIKFWSQICRRSLCRSRSQKLCCRCSSPRSWGLKYLMLTERRCNDFWCNEGWC